MPADSRAEIVIKPATGLRLRDLAEVWRYRALLGSMARRQITGRMSDMWLGVFWILARPIAMTLSFVFIRNISAAQMGGIVPYPLFAFSGLVLWFYMAGTIAEVAGALSRNAGLVQKVYFPRLVSPTVPVIANLVELALGAVLIAAMMAYYGVWPSWRLALLPVVLLQMMALVLGIGLIFSSLNLLSRDWDQFLALFLYLGLFISPVLYAADRLPEKVRFLYHLNPFAGTLTAVRSCLFGEIPFPVQEWVYAASVSLVLILLAVVLFRRTESQMLDKL